MKLKKIASLALAGIMAVSMLAGCGEAASSSEPTTPPETVTGAAAAINAELDNNKDKISFDNDSVLQNLLTDFYAKNPIRAGFAADVDTVVNPQNVNDDIVKTILSVLNVKNDMATFNDGKLNNKADMYVCNSINTKKVTGVELYILNADKLTEAGALKMVGQYIDDLVLPEEGTAGAADKDYSYTGSVAAIKAQTEGKTESVWVIAVTITQTPSAK